MGTIGGRLAVAAGWVAYTTILVGLRSDGEQLTTARPRGSDDPQGVVVRSNENSVAIDVGPDPAIHLAIRHPFVTEGEVMGPRECVAAQVLGIRRSGRRSRPGPRRQPEWTVAIGATASRSRGRPRGRRSPRALR